MDHRTRRTDPTNFEGVAANNDNLMHRHVMEVSLDKGILLLQQNVEVITVRDKI
jgi:hypothetical protein